MKEQNKEREKILKLLKSGDFTIVYWDSGEATLYSKKWDKEEEYARDEYETMNKFIVFEDNQSWSGYCPKIVELLTEALGGKSDSI